MVAAIESALRDLQHYPDPDYGMLREALGRHHHLHSDQILPGNGAAELLNWACRDLALSDGVLLPVPAFGDYSRALEAFDARFVPCPLLQRQTWLKTDAILEMLLRRARNYRRPGLLLNNPHNPTGLLLPREGLLTLLEVFDPVVVDEAFMDFLPPDRQQSLLDLVCRYPNLVVVRSQTKFYCLPGLRLGYAVGDPQRLQRWRRWRDPWTVNSLAAAAAIAAVDDVAFQRLTWNWLQRARPQLYVGLEGIPHLNPLSGAVNFLLVNCDRSVTQLQETLLRSHRILIRDCLSFPELGDRYFRVAVRTLEDNQRLLSALETELAT